uniref:Uncharacterized protein n=1 Tax=Acrasis kona TaxID=1008807 RepID=A0A0B4MZ06_9EUKA|nr:hypothetical protein [Acrasis kona]AID52044.1 hypothetical protein [Acrasis kona]
MINLYKIIKINKINNIIKDNIIAADNLINIFNIFNRGINMKLNIKSLVSEEINIKIYKIEK